jgi:stringent starvation protein B
MANSERFLWVCELNKDQPIKKWKATDLTEDDDADDQDYVLHSLVVKTAVLGGKAVDNERNIVALKTKGYHEKEFEQPIFSLTLGRNDMINNLDLIISTRDNQEVEFKLVDGSGPVYITCMHVLEIPAAEEGQTMMTTSELEDEDEEEEEEEEEEAEEDITDEKAIKEKAANKRKAIKNGTNGNGAHHEVEAEAETDDKPRKRRRN